MFVAYNTWMPKSRHGLFWYNYKDRNEIKLAINNQDYNYLRVSGAEGKSLVELNAMLIKFQEDKKKKDAEYSISETENWHFDFNKKFKMKLRMELDRLNISKFLIINDGNYIYDKGFNVFRDPNEFEMHPVDDDYFIELYKEFPSEKLESRGLIDLKDGYYDSFFYIAKLDDDEYMVTYKNKVWKRETVAFTNEKDLISFLEYLCRINHSETDIRQYLEEADAIYKRRKKAVEY